MKPLAQAQREVLESLAPLTAVEVALSEAAGLALAESVSAPHHVPPFANSAMDGYAVRSEDVLSVPVTLRVLEDVPAGSVSTAAVEPGTAVKIMTGAPIPVGADAVVRVEDTEPGGAEVTILASVETGTSVREAGGDIRAGTVVIPVGQRLFAPHLGVLASLGVVAPRVHRRPRVGLMSTGDELVHPEEQVLEPGQIRDSNRPLLTAALRELGAEVLDFGIIGDDAGSLQAALEKAAREADVVVTSGGVSMGEYDVVKRLLSELGRVEFWQVAMQPAKPFGFGRVGDTPFFGLPGNPVSVMVAFEQFVRPALLLMMGSRLLFRPRILGLSSDRIETDPTKTVFVRVTTSYREGRWLATPSGSQASNALSALAAADAFLVVPQEQPAVEAGAEVELEMLRWPESRSGSEALQLDALEHGGSHG